ncbi:TetR/AcrR family transcriptional regulator [Ancylobacter radicis]|uniref:TetR/AcrR family transcriptional regulator n=1 Tax=Ancylobacter radicis TaxID=2836179 RepID=A0ABS5R9U4_9HYPH|nr:TetR/AcrR family transcriptional regulator [Ancylobacter radicis]MBS9478449.1 TetR/AcrR family transcriptional regulator [Ancylobacter radicis]
MIETVARRTLRGGRPSRGKAQEPVERILETATRLFASRGFAGTSIDQVATLCGAGKDTIYRRFPSKVALFEAVVEHARARALAQVPDLTAIDGEPLERLERLLRMFLAINMEPDLVSLKRITFSEAVVFERSNPVLAQPDPLMARLVEAVAAAQASGALSPGGTDALAAHLIHALVSIPTTDAMLGGAAYATPDALEAHFTTTWEWLLRGVSARGNG